MCNREATLAKTDRRRGQSCSEYFQHDLSHMQNYAIVEEKKQCIVPLHKIQQKKMQNTCLVLGVRIEVGLGAGERGPAQQQEGGFWEC